MIINEKGLQRAMKEAYKGSGYTVAGVQRKGEPEQIVIMAAAWIVKLNRAQCPRDILGLIVMHSGELPRVGEAYRVMKDYVQTAIYDKLLGSLGNCEEKRRAYGVYMAQTKLLMDGAEVWQTAEDRRITLLDPGFTRMVDKTEAACCKSEDMACFVGELAEVYIMPITPKDRETIQELNHLAAMTWVGK